MKLRSIGFCVVAAVALFISSPAAAKSTYPTSPLTVRLMLHYFDQVTPYPESGADVDAVRQYLIRSRMLKRSDSGSGFDYTPKGLRYLDKVLKVKP